MLSSRRLDRQVLSYPLKRVNSSFEGSSLVRINLNFSRSLITCQLASEVTCLNCSWSLGQKEPQLKKTISGQLSLV